MSIDFAALAAQLLSHSGELVPQWLPGGKRHGREWVCGNLAGEPGRSCSINLETGVWKDFDSGEGGSDLTSLYASIHHVTQSEAAKALGATNGSNGHAPRQAAPETAPDRPEAAPLNHPPIPAHLEHGPAWQTWFYYLADDAGPVMAVSRYEPFTGPKVFSQHTWRHGKWFGKSYPAPRPLYRLRELNAKPTLPVLIVEGEKACDSATSSLPTHIVVSWAGGCNAIKQTDWTPLKGRTVTLWPDADVPGREAMAKISPVLMALSCAVSVIPTEGFPDKWDAADAAEEGRDIGAILASAKPISNVVSIDPKRASRAKPERARASVIDHGTGEATGSQFVRWQNLGLTLTPGGAPHENVSNVSLVFQKHPSQAGHIWFDSFRGRVYHNLRGKDEQWIDADDTSATTWMQQTMGFHKVSTGVVREAIQHAARQNTHNSLTEWLESLEWDGIPRLATWLSDCLGVDRNPYSEAVARNWPIAMVARAFLPGVQMDNMPVLEGRMGRGKSTFLEILGNPWFASLPDEFGSKDFLQAIQGRWLIEVPDMTGFSKREHTHILAIITRRNDPYRASYGRLTEDHPRVSVFAATSETDDYLQDPRGVRRYWPLRCGSIDLDALRSIRDQVFAESVQMFRNSATWYECPAIDTLDEQRERITKDPWEDAVSRCCNAVVDANKIDAYVKIEVQISAILGQESGLDIPKERQSRKEVTRVASILRDLGWVQAWPKDPVSRKTRAVWIPDPKPNR